MTRFERLRCRLMSRKRRSKEPTTQSHNGPLARLPIEIRLQIWREVIGGNLCHMMIDSKSHALKCFLCRDFSKKQWNVRKRSLNYRELGTARCRGGVRNEPCYVSYPQKMSFHASSLLLTSRAVHSEALQVLYESNVFDINDLQIVQAMVRRMGSHVSTIKTVRIDLNVWQIRLKDVKSRYNSAYDNWVRKWELLAGEFSNLQHLRLDIWGCAPWRDFHKEDLEPLLKLRGLKTFYLAIWHHRGDANDQDLEISAPIERYFQNNICE
ncbi:MAG: hypothetical protein Q9178_003437 [Gyalolechia marmorata]